MCVCVCVCVLGLVLTKELPASVDNIRFDDSSGGKFVDTGQNDLLCLLFTCVCGIMAVLTCAVKLLQHCSEASTVFTGNKFSQAANTDTSAGNGIGPGTSA